MSNTSSVILGQAAVRLLFDSSELSGGLDLAKKKMLSFKEAFGKFGDTATKIGAFAGYGISRVVSEFASFDDTMRTVQAVTGSTGSSFEALTQLALKLGRETAFTSKQVSEGMVALGRMGFSDSEITESIAGVMNLSLATGTELAQAAEIAANNMRVFGLTAADTGRAADILSVTANSSAQTLQDLGEALKMAGPHANMAGAALDETCAALGVLANMGIRGSLAGTALGKSFKRLADPAVQEYLEQFGIKTVDAEGNLLNMAETLTKIGRAAAGMGSGEQLAFMDKVFDARGSLGGGVLSFNVEGMDAFLAKLRDSAGAANTAARTMEGGIGGTLRELDFAAEGARIELGRIAAITFTPMLKSLTGGALALHEWMNNSQGIVTMLLQMTAGLSAAGLGVKGFSMAGGAIKNLSAPFLAMDAALVGMSLFGGRGKGGGSVPAPINLPDISKMTAADQALIRSMGPTLGEIPPAAQKATGALAAFWLSIKAGLKSTWAFIAAHPVTLILAAVVAAIASLKIMADRESEKLDKAYQDAKKKSEDAAALTGKHQQQNQNAQTDFVRLQQLAEISEKAPLAAEQVTELETLLGRLDGYGSREWTSFDTLTGKLTVAANAQEKLNEKMREVARMDALAEIAAAENEVTSAREKLNGLGKGASGIWNVAWRDLSLRNLGGASLLGIDEKRDQSTGEHTRLSNQAFEDLRASTLRLQALQRKLQAIDSGSMEEVTGIAGKSTAEKVAEYNAVKAAEFSRNRKYDDYLPESDAETARNRERDAFTTELESMGIESLAGALESETASLAAVREEYIAALREARSRESESGTDLSDTETARLDALQNSYSDRQRRVDDVRERQASFKDKMDRGPYDSLRLTGSFFTADILSQIGGAAGPQEETAKNTRQTATSVAAMLDYMRNNGGLTFA